MAIVNFSIPKVLEHKIKTAIIRKGFSSKAELFRFAVIRYLDEDERLPLSKNSGITFLSHELEKELTAKICQTPLPSLPEQLKRLKNL